MPQSNPRFSEQLRGNRNLARLLFAFVFVGGVFAAAGLAMVVFLQPLPLRVIGVGFGLGPIMIMLLSLRSLRVEVRDDGVHYWNGLVFRHGHVPASEITAVTWREGNAHDSDIFTRDDWEDFKARRDAAIQEQGRSSGAWFVPQRVDVRRVTHGARAIDTASGRAPLQSDVETEGVVRIDDDAGSVYLFATDSPEEFVSAVERVRELAGRSESDGRTHEQMRAAT
jgi:hypothetical protein